MADTNEILKYKMDLWKYLTDSVNEKKNNTEKISNAVTVTGIIISAINTVGSEADAVDSVLAILSLAIPLIILMFLFWFSLNNRTVAIMQGYLAGLEDSINFQLEGRIYQVNSYFHNLFSKKYFPSNNYISILYIIVILMISYFSFYNMFVNQLISSIWIILYLIIYIIFVWILLKELTTNPRIRGIARAYFHYISFSSEIDKMNLKDFLKYKPNIEKMIELYELDDNTYK